MLPEPLVNVLIVLAMFVVRIGVPLAITLALGYWLEKRLPPQEKSEATEMKIERARRAAQSPKIIQWHCWDLKRCSPALRAQCAAFQRPDLPCWLALQVAGNQVREECFTCALYKPQSIAA